MSFLYVKSLTRVGPCKSMWLKRVGGVQPPIVTYSTLNLTTPNSDFNYTPILIQRLHLSQTCRPRNLTLRSSKHTAMLLLDSKQRPG